MGTELHAGSVRMPGVAPSEGVRAARGNLDIEIAPTVEDASRAGPYYAWPIRMPAANTNAPPSTTWKIARLQGVSMYRF